MCDASNVQPTTADEALDALRVIVRKLFALKASPVAVVLDLKVRDLDTHLPFARRSAVGEIRRLAQPRSWETRLDGEGELLARAAELAILALSFEPAPRLPPTSLGPAPEGVVRSVAVTKNAHMGLGSSDAGWHWKARHQMWR